MLALDRSNQPALSNMFTAQPSPLSSGGSVVTDLDRSPTEHEAWLEARRRGVTATDVADAAAGTYGGIYGVVARKLGLETVEENAEMRRGTAWQPVIADAVHTLTGLYVVGEETLAGASDERWMATVDGFLAPEAEVSIDEVQAVLEIKTRGVGTRPNRDRWHVQMQWQLHVTGLSRALLAEATIDDDANECRGVRLEWVEADPDLQAQLVDLAEVVYAHVQSGTLPEPDSPSALDSVKAVHAAADVDADAVDLSDLAEDIARFDEIKAAVKAVSDERDLLEARIRDAIGEATKGHLDGWRISLSQPARKLTRDAEAELLDTHPEYATAVLDRTRVKAEDPELYEAFTRPVGSRRLTITPPKGE